MATTTPALYIPQDLNFMIVFFNLLVSFIFGIITAYVYKLTHRGLSYSQSFVMTLVVAGVIITGIIMVIGNSVALAFGAFGAFSIIRFRTAVKDTKDVIYLYLVLSLGMAVGTGNYHIALGLLVVVLGVLMVLTRLNFGTIKKFDYILTFVLDTQKSPENAYQPVFDKFLKSSNILNIKAQHAWHILLLSFTVSFINEKESGECVSELKKIEGVSDVNLITVKNDIEY